MRAAGNSERGVTLIELLVAIVVATILLTVGVSGFQSLIIRERVASATNDLVSDLSMARMEAINRHAMVVLCSSSGAGCTNSLDWSSGWIVFQDTDTDYAFDPASGDQLIRTHPSLNQVKIVMSTDAKIIAFNETGYPTNHGSSLVSGPHGVDETTVCIEYSGAIYARSGNIACP